MINSARTRTNSTDTRSVLIRRIAIILIAVMAVTQIIMLDFSYAEDTPAGTGSSVAAGEQNPSGEPAAQEPSSDQTGQPSAQTAAPEGIKAYQTKSSKKIIESNDLPEAEAIAAYGTFHGKNARRIPVITYHRVVSDKQKKKGAAKSSSLYVSQSTFRKQMKWLHKHGYRTLNCQEFLLWYEGKISLPKKSVLITFDDSRACLAKYAYPVLKEFNMKGTVFTIGRGVLKNRKDSIKKKDIPKLQEEYPTVEYQSHTFALHRHYSMKGVYKRIKKDAAKQKKYFGFDYIAYPYGNSTKAMRKAYKDSGIKMGFAYGDNGYATRKQDRYQIRRIKIYGNGSMYQFRRWFR